MSDEEYFFDTNKRYYWNIMCGITPIFPPSNPELVYQFFGTYKEAENKLKREQDRTGLKYGFAQVVKQKGEFNA